MLKKHTQLHQFIGAFLAMVIAVSAIFVPGTTASAKSADIIPDPGFEIFICETILGGNYSFQTAIPESQLDDLAELYYATFGEAITQWGGSCNYGNQDSGSLYCSAVFGGLARWADQFYYVGNHGSWLFSDFFCLWDQEPFSQDNGGGQVSGELETDFTVTFTGNYNGTVTFPAGNQCDGNCVAGPYLPAKAKDALPDDGVYGTAYVQIFQKEDAGLLNTDGTFTVCFDTTDVKNPVLYQFVGDEWVARVSGGSNPLCYSGASGAGAFYLGGN